MLCSQPIVWKTRTIKDNQQFYVEENSSIDLYQDQVVTPSEAISLENIFDVSFKKFSGASGLLYLHTNQGVKAYMVKEPPFTWMETFHQYK